MNEAKQSAAFVVWTLDVWGHGADDCGEEHEPECAAVLEGEGAEKGTGACDCNRHEDCGGFDINDRCKVGTIEIETDENGPCDEAIFTALLDGGFLKSSVKLADVEIDDPSCDGASLYLNQASDGCPIFQIERVETEGAL